MELLLYEIYITPASGMSYNDGGFSNPIPVKGRGMYFGDTEAVDAYMVISGSQMFPLILPPNLTLSVWIKPSVTVLSSSLIHTSTCLLSLGMDPTLTKTTFSATLISGSIIDAEISHPSLADTWNNIIVIVSYVSGSSTYTIMLNGSITTEVTSFGFNKPDNTTSFAIGARSSCSETRRL